MSYLRAALTKRVVFDNPQDFLNAAIDYFEWVDDHPLLEENASVYKGEVTRYAIRKTRPYTKKGLATYLGIPDGRIDIYRKTPGWEETIEMVEQAIYTQKFEHAAAGLMNASIISRDLGLAEKTEIGGIKDAPPVAFNITPMATGTFLTEE